MRTRFKDYSYYSACACGGLEEVAQAALRQYALMNNTGSEPPCSIWNMRVAAALHYLCLNDFYQHATRQTFGPDFTDQQYEAIKQEYDPVLNAGLDTMMHQLAGQFNEQVQQASIGVYCAETTKAH